MREIDNYSYVMDEAIKTNTLTSKELRKSSLYTEYWFACIELAKAIVDMNKLKSESVRSFKGWDLEDLADEFAMVLVKKFDAQISAMNDPKSDESGIVHVHNHNAYTATIFTNWINDLIKPLEIKRKERVIDTNKKEHYISKNVTYKDENGKDVKLYYRIMSLSTPINDDDDSLTLEDTLENNTYSPEKAMIAKEEDTDAFETLKKLFKAKRYLGSIYVYIEDELMNRGISCSYESMKSLFERADSNPVALLHAQNRLVTAFNDDLVKYVYTIASNTDSEDIVSFINNHFATDFNNFGSFTMNDDAIFHRRREYLVCIAKIKHIDVPKKYTKKKIAC